MPRRRRILLGQLGANGDCVYATTVARQIKADDPECHLTWAIGSSCRQVIEHNPHVDSVWEVPYSRREEMQAIWRSFEKEARDRQRGGDFDDVYFTQIYPDNLQNFDGTVRASIFRGYPRRITVPVTPVIRLSQEEVEAVARFAAQHGLTKGGPAVMFESAPGSGQSPMTSRFAQDLARRLLAVRPELRIIMSSGMPGELGVPAFVDASKLKFRQIAELARYCSLFVGCSSGLTWLLTSDAAPTIPMIQVLSGAIGDYGAVVHDLEYWGLASGHVIELHDCSAEHAARCAVEVLVDGVSRARDRYHENLPVSFDHYFDMMFPPLRRGDLRTVVTSLRHTIMRYGPRPELARALVKRILGKAARNLRRPS